MARDPHIHHSIFFQVKKRTFIGIICLCSFLCSQAQSASHANDKSDEAAHRPAPDTTRVEQNHRLDNVVIYGNTHRSEQMKLSQTSVQVNRDYLRAHFAGSLMQSLQDIPGVKAMSIGSGQSKPTIRGLGFNRMAVTQDGIKHEGQQWGDDHGLEIDQFALDRIEVIKGPAALLYGSDAIGGVINLYSNYVPTGRFQGSANLFTRSNNESLGASLKLEGRSKKFYYKTNATYIDYADYKVPTDSIQYYSYNIGLKNRSLRNTAGGEKDGSVTMGYLGRGFRTDIRLSDSYAKSGFFANAHGLEVRLSDIDYDASRRDIDLPYQEVNHFKAATHSAWQIAKFDFEADLAYQNNLRKERSEPVSHGYMPKPNGTMERRFLKHTYTALLGMHFTPDDRHTVRAGMNAEYQHNRRGGWGFIMPDFETMAMGAYAFDRFTIRKDLIVNAGLRYDYVRTKIHGYRDWYKTPVGIADSVYKERSATFGKTFHSLTWSAGINYAIGAWMLKANVGKSFRVPIAKELGADGVNYHIFRYEKGNTTLRPEESYQIDAGINWTSRLFTVQLDPYFNYFPNYIYMNPTADYYEGLQVYNYTQARVLRYGFELTATCHLSENLEAQVRGAYLHATQQSGNKKGYTLPFSPPPTMDATVKYIFCNGRHEQEGYLSLTTHLVGPQHDIVPPEKPTPGYLTLNMTAGRQFTLGNRSLRVALNADNLLNRKYYDHTSYYRLIDVPEPGRNVALLLGFEF
ncbi:TonB-dependent receptor [Hoylesella marshii]|uniref:TonB-dependent receptor n=1 Tax=Hoylesella marshii DSM 16973 = JCM 13450 TaxID=862515 RepID=E0NTJ4_9BACT|nr:TonB-dependent receptor [Hoylesella marshii DSM 16973 = JCM 13450]